MNIHSGARSCRASRALLVERITGRGWPVEVATAAAGPRGTQAPTGIYLYILHAGARHESGKIVRVL